MNYLEKVSISLKNNTINNLVRIIFLLFLLAICFLMGYNFGLIALILAAGWYFIFINKDPEVPLWISVIFILPLRIPVSFFGTEYQIKLLFFGFVFISFFSYQMQLLREKVRPKLPFIIPVLILLVIYIIGAVRSDAPLLDRAYDLRSFIFRNIFFYLLINIYSRKDLAKIIKAISITSVILALVGIYQHVFKSYFVSNCNLPDFRAMGTFDHPNQFALFLFISGIFSIGMFFYSKAIKHKYYYGAVFILNLTALLMTYSRSLWICLLASLALFFLMYKKKAVIILAAALLLILLLPSNLKDRFMNPINMRDPSHQIRAGLIVNGLNMIKNNIIFGVGAGNSYYQYDKYKKVETVGVKKIHTQLIAFTAEYGITGLAVFVYLMSVLLLAMIRKIKLLDKNNKILQYALISILVGLMINAQFNGNFFQESYIWLIMGLGIL